MKFALWQGNGQIMAFVSSTLTNNVIKPNLGACNVGFVIAARSVHVSAFATMRRLSQRLGDRVLDVQAA